MGACLAVDEAAARSRSIDRQLGREFSRERRIVKLLLLGTGQRQGGVAAVAAQLSCHSAGGSGKSTILKQMKILHGSADTEDARPGITEAERAQHVATCRANVVESMAAVLEVGRHTTH